MTDSLVEMMRRKIYMTNHYSEQLTIGICGHFLLKCNIYCNYYKYTITFIY